MNIKGDLSSRAGLVASICSDSIDYRLNNNQLGVSLAASFMLSAKVAQQQIWIVPGGLGKSRILIGTMLGLALGPKTCYNEFIVVYNHDQLFNQDSDKLLRVAQLYGFKVTPMVASRDNLVVPVPNLQTVVLFDEADHVLLDRKTKVKLNGRSTQKPLMIGLTATREKDYVEVERVYLGNLGFRMKDSGMLPSEGSKVEPKATTIESFFGEEYDGMGRILYCPEESYLQYHN